MIYLTKVKEVYRVETQEEADAFLQDLKENRTFVLDAFSCKNKEVKVKGEVVDTWVEVTVQKIFNDPKDPVTMVEVNYNVS